MAKFSNYSKASRYAVFGSRKKQCSSKPHFLRFISMYWSGFFPKNSVTSRLQCILRLLLCSVVYHVIQGHSISIYKDDCLMTAWWLHDDYLVIGLVIATVIYRLCSHYLAMNRHFDYLGTDYIESLFSNQHYRVPNYSCTSLHTLLSLKR